VIWDDRTFTAVCSAAGTDSRMTAANTSGAIGFDERFEAGFQAETPSLRTACSGQANQSRLTVMVMVTRATSRRFNAASPDR
jgi:hypothetical protein